MSDVTRIPLGKLQVTLPLHVYHQVFRPKLSQNKIIEIRDAEGRVVIPWPGFDDCSVSKTERLRRARFIVKCVNAMGGK